jgi:thiamine-phosphate pyrophosphorylase
MKPALPRLWIITDRRLVTGDLVGVVDAALRGVPRGSTGVILREKDLDGRPLLALAERIRRVTSDLGALFVVNGRLDIAIASGADGIHLGGDAPPFEAIRPLAGERLIGVSIHGDEAPPEPADYALIAPVFQTASKPGAPGIGIEGLRAACARTKVPVFALGGIEMGTALDCVRAGAAGVGVIRSVLCAPEPGIAARGLAGQIRASTR